MVPEVSRIRRLNADEGFQKPGGGSRTIELLALAPKDKDKKKVGKTKVQGAGCKGSQQDNIVLHTVVPFFFFNLIWLCCEY